MLVRFSKVDDRNKLKEFIHKHWKENHILSSSDQILDFQHLNSLDGLNFVIAEKNNQIFALLGFIPLSQYDKNLKKNKDIWLAIWKVKDKAPTGIGLKLLDFIENELKPSTIGSIGINSKVEKIYKLLKFKSFTLNQYYIRNNNITNYQLIEVNKKNERDDLTGKEAELRYIDNDNNEWDSINFSNNFRPIKSIEYVKNRYLKHPIYKYDLLGSYIDNELVNVFICKPIEVKEMNSFCYRIVDVLGDYEFNYSIKNAFQKILVKHNFEYVDCYNYGIEELNFKKLGFNKVSDEVIPNYFEPFLKETINIMSAIKMNRNFNYVVFKGDSDQDRPNRI